MGTGLVGFVKRQWGCDVVRIALGTLGLGALYFLVPVRAVEAGAPGRVVAVLALLSGLSLVVISHLRNTASRLSNLILLLMGIVVCFSIIFYIVATRSPGEFNGIETRIDALYFTLTTMTTTGYGDVAAVGQSARALVIAVFVFDLVFLALLINAIGQLLRSRSGRTGTREAA